MGCITLFECVTPRLYASVTENGVEVLQQYGEDDVLKITVKKFGPNSLVDFYDWSFRKSTDSNKALNNYYERGFDAEGMVWESFMAQWLAGKNYYSNNKDGNETSAHLYDAPFKTSCTDYFSPYVVRAMGNVDGDLPSSYDFTGIAHKNAPIYEDLRIPFLPLPLFMHCFSDLMVCFC